MYFALIMRPITLAYSILLSSKVSFELPWIQVIGFLPPLLCVPYQTPENWHRRNLSRLYWMNISPLGSVPPHVAKNEGCHTVAFVMKQTPSFLPRTFSRGKQNEKTCRHKTTESDQPWNGVKMKTGSTQNHAEFTVWVDKVWLFLDQYIHWRCKTQQISANISERSCRNTVYNSGDYASTRVNKTPLNRNCQASLYQFITGMFKCKLHSNKLGIICTNQWRRGQLVNWFSHYASLLWPLLKNSLPCRQQNLHRIQKPSADMNIIWI